MNQSRRRFIKEQLDKVPSLKELYSDIRKDLDAVETELRRFTESPNPIVAEISDYLFRKAGKRIRPALVMLCAKHYGYQGEEHIRMSALVETIHTASLIHDDIIDNSDIRRGKPTVHSRWGSNITVLMGDFLYITTLRLSLDSSHREIVEILTETSAGMIDGELNEYHQSGNLDLGEDDHLDILSKKTASLFAASCRIGGILGGAGPEELERLDAYGMHLGMAFQLTDDLLDYTGSAKTLGKPVLADLQEGRITLPLIYALSRVDSTEKRRIGRLFKDRRENRSASREILDFVRANGALDFAHRVASDFARKAQADLEPLAQTDQVMTLKLMPEYILQRNT